ncbi:hypothetical protein ACFL2V_03375 [Pseudomonadota bacterium]
MNNQVPNYAYNLPKIRGRVEGNREKRAFSTKLRKSQRTQVRRLREQTRTLLCDDDLRLEMEFPELPMIDDEYEGRTCDENIDLSDIEPAYLGLVCISNKEDPDILARRIAYYRKKLADVLSGVFDPAGIRDEIESVGGQLIELRLRLQGITDEEQRASILSTIESLSTHKKALMQSVTPIHQVGRVHTARARSRIGRYRRTNGEKVVDEDSNEVTAEQQGSKKRRTLIQMQQEHEAWRQAVCEAEKALRDLRKNYGEWKCPALRRGVPPSYKKRPKKVKRPSLRTWLAQNKSIQPYS